MFLLNISPDIAYEGIISSDSIIHGPDYSGLNAESWHVAFIVLVFVVALVAVSTALSSSSPKAKAVVAIVSSVIIAAFVIVSLYMKWI